MSAEERDQFEHAEALAPIRSSVNVDGRKSVWELRKISPPRTALILEIGPHHDEPILRAHLEWLDDLAEMMEERLRLRRARLERGDRPRPEPERRKATRAIREQISRHFFADA